MRIGIVSGLLLLPLFGQPPAATKAPPATNTPAVTKAPPPLRPLSPTAPKPAATPALPPLPTEPGLYGIMNTTMGVIRFKLYEKEAPITVRNFVELAQGRKMWKTPQGRMVRTPLFNGLSFHRVIPAFMVQGGDPTGTGSGEVGFVIDDEFHPDLKFDKPGVFGMANAGPRTGSSQFFITEVPTPWLNGKHSVFAQVIDGQEVVNSMARVPRDEGDKPRTPVKIVTVTFTRVGPRPPNAPEAGPVAPPVMKKAAAPVAAPPVKKATPAPVPAKK